MITLGCVVAIGYQIFALLACLRFLARRDPEPAGTPGFDPQAGAWARPGVPGSDRVACTD